MNQKSKFSWRLAGIASLIAIPFLAVSVEIDKNDSSLSNAERLPKVVHSLLLDIAPTSSGYVAVGERGHIIISADGKNWQQLDVPTRSTLTTVSVSGQSIWAAGHDGIILHSADAGKSWQRQRVIPWSKDSTEITNGSPVLDTLFTDENTGYAIGAYSLALKTVDGGANWLPLVVSAPQEAAPAAALTADDSGTFDESMLEMGADSDPHLNAITRTESGKLLIMGERGAGFLSADEGATWRKVQLEYKGSMFGVISLGGERVVSFGLRGNVYESNDAGATWTKQDSGTQASLLGGVMNDKGDVAIVGGNGTLLLRKADETGFTAKHLLLSAGQTPSFTSVTPASDGFLMASDMGYVHYRVQ